MNLHMLSCFPTCYCISSFLNMKPIFTESGLEGLRAF